MDINPPPSGDPPPTGSSPPPGPPPGSGGWSAKEINENISKKTIVNRSFDSIFIITFFNSI